MLSQRTRTIEPSATLVVNALRLKLRAQGRTIYNFGVGEPDFPTPPSVVEAGIAALRNGWTRYTAVPGVPELRAGIARNLERSHGVEVAPEQVIVTSGAKQALWEYLQAMVDPGDEVLVPAPYWVSYPDMIRLCDGIPIEVLPPRDEGYRVTPELLEEHVTPRTVGLILNSPSNPTGVVLDRDECQALVRFAEAHDLWILSDEIYDRYVYDGEFVSPLTQGQESRVTVVNGVSKSYSMTGWRIGWAIGRREIIDGMARLQGHTASNAAAVSQAAALAAVTAGEGSDVQVPLDAFCQRRDLALARLDSMPGMRVVHPQGAFYIFMDLDDVLADDETSVVFCEDLLQRQGVALVPGEAFGASRSARLSYACSSEELQGGLDALASYLDERGS